MNKSQAFFSKLTTKPTIQKAERKAKQYCVFHDLIVCPHLYQGRYPEVNEKQGKFEDETEKYTNSRSSFYACKRIVPNTPLERLPILIAKRIAYRKQNKLDQWGRVVYNDTQSKNIDHVSTEFQCYQLLKGSHRAVQLTEFLHENTKSSEDKKFFYQFMKLSDRRSLGIKNIMFVLEEMNEGSLKDQIERIVNKKQEKFTEEAIIDYTCQIGQGLIELKQRGIIHRDLRPENILFHNKQIKFSDFDSAFIRGYSNYKNIKNGVNMKDTTPLQIMLLISESQERLKKYESEELYQLQKNADIYFLGVNIYTMIFSHPFESFNGGKVLNNLINIKKRNGFCPKLLDLMARCLEKDSHVRIDLDTVIKLLSEIEMETYFKSSTYTKVYLSSEPLNLHTFSSNQVEERLKSESIVAVLEKTNDTYNMNKNFTDKVRQGTVERHTQRYEIFVKDVLAQKQNENMWIESSSETKIKAEQQKLRNLIEEHLQRLQIKAFYYELAYRILCEVNLDNLMQAENCYLQNIQSHLDLLSNELVVLLTFLYDMIIKCPFTQDPKYLKDNIGYENKRVFDNIRTLCSRKAFFAGRKKVVINSFNIEDIQKKLKQYKEEHGNEANTGQIEQIQQGVKFVIQSVKKVGHLESSVQDFYEATYENSDKRKSFQVEYHNLKKFLKNIEKLVKQETIQTIINLIIAYEKLKIARRNNSSNLKNAIFMLMILESQDTNKIHKNDMVIIKTELTNMINLRLGWKSEELEAFFTNYTEIHKEQVAQGLHELQSQAFLAGVSSQSFDPEEEEIQYGIRVEEPPKVPEKKASIQEAVRDSNSETAKARTQKVKTEKVQTIPSEEPEKNNVSFRVEEEPQDESVLDENQFPEIKINKPEEPLKQSMGQTFDFHFDENPIMHNRGSIQVQHIEDN